VTAKLLAAAGGDGRYVAMGGKELLHLGQRKGRLWQEIQPELNKLGIAERRFSSLDKLRRRARLNGHA
jgi:hypothetical protein